MADVVALGEAMVELRPGPEPGLLAATIAGDVANTSVCLARLGVDVRFVQKVGADVFARLFRRVLDGEEGLGAGLRYVEGRNGVYAFDMETGDDRGLTYWREGSAASRTLDDETFPSILEEATEARVLVTSGIALAVQRRRDLLHDLMARAHDAGTAVFFVVNARVGLLRQVGEHVAPVSPAALLCEITRLLPHVDVISMSDQDLALLGTDLDAMAAGRTAFLTRGSRGALAVAPDGARCEVATAPVTEVVDALGAGDAFAAGVVYGLLRGWSLRRCAEAGAAVAALCVSGRGTWHPGITREAFLALVERSDYGS